MRRQAMLLLATLVLGGCSVPVVVENPQTGETVTCTEGAGDQSPWSQREACVSDHVAQGWTVKHEN